MEITICMQRLFIIKGKKQQRQHQAAFVHYVFAYVLLLKLNQCSLSGFAVGI
jgi:hypothetical protein